MTADVASTGLTSMKSTLVTSLAGKLFDPFISLTVYLFPSASLTSAPWSRADTVELLLTYELTSAALPNNHNISGKTRNIFSPAHNIWE